MAKRKAVKKIAEVETQYECNKCKDRKHILRNGKMQKCTCVIKKEIEEYLDFFPKSVPINKKATVDAVSINLTYENVDIKYFLARAKSFMFKQYFKGDVTYSFNSGFEYTDAYVNGIDDYFFTVDFLFLKLGRDNYNQSQLTTFLTLLTSRVEQGLVTWVYIYPDTPKSTLVSLYGIELYNYLMNRDIFKRVVK